MPTPLERQEHEARETPRPLFRAPPRDIRNPTSPRPGGLGPRRRSPTHSGHSPPALPSHLLRERGGAPPVIRGPRSKRAPSGMLPVVRGASQPRNLDRRTASAASSRSRIEVGTAGAGTAARRASRAARTTVGAATRPAATAGAAVGSVGAAAAGRAGAAGGAAASRAAARTGAVTAVRRIRTRGGEAESGRPYDRCERRNTPSGHAR